jgi:hypothetical protein
VAQIKTSIGLAVIIITIVLRQRRTRIEQGLGEKQRRYYGEIVSPLEQGSVTGILSSTTQGI